MEHHTRMGAPPSDRRCESEQSITFLFRFRRDKQYTMAARQLFPVSRMRRSRVFETIFDRYLDDGDEEPWDLMLPPDGLVAVPVAVVVEALRLPGDLVLVVMGFFRPTRVEVLAVHLLVVVLDAARQEEEFWLQRQHRYLKAIRE